MLRPPSRPANPHGVSGAGEGQPGDPLRAARSKRGRARTKRRAGGEHIVDQQRMHRGLGRHANARRVGQSLHPRPTDLAPPVRAMQAPRHHQSRLGRQPRRDLLGRIESPPPSTPRCRRHRDDHPGEQLGRGAHRDRACRVTRKGGSRTELERGHERPRRSLVWRRRPGLVQPRDRRHPRSKPAEPPVAGLTQLRPGRAAAPAQRAARRRNQTEQLGEHGDNDAVGSCTWGAPSATDLAPRRYEALRIGGSVARRADGPVAARALGLIKRLIGTADEGRRVLVAVPLGDPGRARGAHRRCV
jgi:hypothetical protein